MRVNLLSLKPNQHYLSNTKPFSMKFSTTFYALALAFCLFLPFSASSQFFESAKPLEIRGGSPDDLLTTGQPPQQDRDPVFQTQEDIDRFLDRFRSFTDRIVGGEDADILDYPWQVSLQLQPQFGGSHFCGGTIVDDRWLITASHCLVFEDQNGDDLFLEPHHLRIRAGFTHMNTTQGSFYNVEEIILHPDYSSNSHRFDIALVKLVSNFNLNDPAQEKVPYVRQIDVAQGLVDPGTLAKVSGWGALAWQGPGSNTLQAVEVPIVAGHASYPPSWITADMLLAGEAGKDACQGDSGGPLVVPDGQGGYKLAGVVSWGNNCGLAGYPGVYARISYFESWLNEYLLSADPNQYSVFHYEDFGDGQLPDGWVNNVIEGPTNFPGWEWTTTGGAYGGQLNSTTAANGYLILNSDAHGAAGAMEEADLISPAFDFSDVTANIVMSLEHWARTFGNADIRIYISSDDFDTQTELYRWHDAEQHDANGPNPTLSEFDITQYAQGESNVKFKFKWIGSYDYWWLIDDFQILTENPPLQLEFVVTDGQNPLDGAYISTMYTGQETFTDADGIGYLTLYEGYYEFTVVREGFFNYSGNVTVSQDGQVVNVVMDKIPAPEIAVTPESIVLDVFKGYQASTALNIANPGDAELTFAVFSQPAGSDKRPMNGSGIEPVTYAGFETNDALRAVSLDDAAGQAGQQNRDPRDEDHVEIHYDSGPATGIGTNTAANWITAVRFTAEELAEYYGVYELGAVRFHISSSMFSAISVKVWEGAASTGNGPAQEIYSADVTADVTANNYTTHVLAEPISLTSGEEYWIGYSMNATGGYPSSADAGPMVADKGGWMFINNSWQQLVGISPNLDRNWVIRGVLYPVIGVDWITLEPASGTVAPEGEQAVDVTFDATSLELGQYQANIVVSNNAGPNVVVPVTMNVVPPAYDVTFVVNDPQGVAIDDAIITLAGQANDAGDYLFAGVPLGSHQYLVTRDGYLDAQGVVMVVDQDVTLTVTLIPDDATLLTLSVEVQDEFNNPVEDAYFILDGFGSFYTDELGQIDIELVEGLYNYSVSKNGMVSLSGSVDVTASQDLHLTMDYLRYDLVLAAEPVTGGTVSGDGEYYHGETVTVTATAADYHDFLHWTENGEVVSDDAQYTFDIFGDRTLVAHFAIHTYEIIATAEPASGGAVSGTGTYEHGETVVLTAAPATLHHFVEWTEDGVVIEDAGETYTFTAEADRTLVAHFAPNLFTLTFDVRGTNQQPITGAVITLNQQTYDAGHYEFEGLLPGAYNYVVSHEGYFNASGSVAIVDADLVHSVVLTVDDTFVDDPSLLQLSLYPVPVTGKLNVSAEEVISEIRIIDVSGRVLVMESPDALHAQVSMESLRPGIYIVKVTTQNSTVTRTIQKQ
jgi:hypothetical protein